MLNVKISLLVAENGFILPEYNTVVLPYPLIQYPWFTVA
jgi:hypothetical protein